MAEKTVTTANGKLYYVRISGGWHYIKATDGGGFGHDSIGDAKSLEDALAIIKAHSGSQIANIK